jgi:hypothetical protein
MANTGFWDDGFQITKDRLNASLLQKDILTNRPAFGQQGRIFHSTDTNQLFYDSGTAWEDVGLISNVQIIKKSADETVNNSSVLQNDDDFLFSIGASEVWFITLALKYTTSVSAGFKFAWTIPSGATIYSWAVPSGIFDNDSGGGSGPETIIAHSSSSVSMLDTQRIQTATIIHAVVLNDVTPGTVQFQWAQSSAEVSNTTLEIESGMMAMRQAA